jgi:hypothetical protein
MNIEQWRKRLNIEATGMTVEPAPTNLGNGSFLKKSVEITGPDGTKMYGCTWDDCEEIAKHPTTIGVAHWLTHEPRLSRRPHAKQDNYDTWTLRDLKDALRQAEAKVARAEAARDKALEQVATVREVTRETIAGLKKELAAVTKERDEVRNAARVLFPGMGS